MFNTSLPGFMHVDLNSCFASIEQQANPSLRGKPVVVGAYVTDKGCILAASREAKKLGIKTGMRVFEAKRIYPRVIVLPSDPAKYRFVSKQLYEVFCQHTDNVEMKSIDEGILQFNPNQVKETLWKIAEKIKIEIKEQAGDWLTVSVGISTNSYFAKLAAGLQKPDGLVEINASNIETILKNLSLESLPYIKHGNRTRLNCVGIYTPLDFFHAEASILRAAFQSVVGTRWHSWLHGFEIPGVSFGGRTPREIDKTIGHSYALTKQTSDDQELTSLLSQLVEKMGKRLRAKNFSAGGIHVYCRLGNGLPWHHGEKLPNRIFANPDLFEAAWKILERRPKEEKVSLLAVNVFDLNQTVGEQISLFESKSQKKELAKALDAINNRFGDWSVFQALSLGTRGKILDRIAFVR